MRELSKNLILFLILIICGFLSLYNLSERNIERWDEETNIQVVEESKDANSFPFLIYQDKNFLEKPPLWYYLTILITKVFGSNLYSYRIVSAVSNIFLLILILIFCKKYFGSNAAIFTGLTYLSTWQIFINNPNNVFSTHHARSADLDFLQLLFIFSTIFVSIEYEKKRNYKLLILIGILTGLGVMTKGLMAILPVLVLTLWEISKMFKLKKFDINSVKQFVIFNLSFLIFALPWHFLMYLKFGNQFIQEYFSYHYVERFSTTIEQHYGWIFFHFYNLFDFNFFSSGIVLIIGLIYLLASKKIREFKYFILFAYSVLTLLIITITQTKLAWYLLYLYPTGVIVCGIFYAYIYLNVKKLFINELKS